jgi:hypothetical protein
LRCSEKEETGDEKEDTADEEGETADTTKLQPLQVSGVPGKPGFGLLGWRYQGIGFGRAVKSKR